MGIENVHEILENVLFEFPVKEINITLPGWIDGLKTDHWLRKDILESVKQWSKEVNKINDIMNVSAEFEDIDLISDVNLKDVALGEGIVEIQMNTTEGLFYDILKEITGIQLMENISC